MSLAKTAAGRELLTTLNTTVESALKERVTAIKVDPDYADQIEHEQQLIREFRSALSAPVCLPYISTAKSTTAKQNTVESTSEESARHDGDIETAGETQHTLLLGAP